MSEKKAEYPQECKDFKAKLEGYIKVLEELDFDSRTARILALQEMGLDITLAK